MIDRKIDGAAPTGAKGVVAQDGANIDVVATTIEGDEWLSAIDSREGEIVVGVAAGDVGEVAGGAGVQIETDLGFLTLNADGGYSYQSKPDTVPEQGQTDVFTYTIQDGDGDKSTATLTINLDTVTLVADDDDISVDEDGLDGIGSAAGTDSEFASGTVADDVTGGVGALSYTLQNPTDDGEIDEVPRDQKDHARHRRYRQIAHQG